MIDKRKKLIDASMGILLGISTTLMINNLMKESLKKESNFKEKLNNEIITKNYPNKTNLSWDKMYLGTTYGEKEVVWYLKSPTMLVGGHGRSLVLKNIILHCVMMPQKWDIYGIDPSRVELTTYEQYDNFKNLKELKDIVEALEVIRVEMLDRYSIMEESQVINFTNLNNDIKAKLIVFENIYLLDFLDSKTESSIEDAAIKARINTIAQEIARLGRAAGIFIVFSTSNNTSKIENRELKYNISYTVGMGKSNDLTIKNFFEKESIPEIDIRIGSGLMVKEPNEQVEFKSYYLTHDYVDNFLTNK